jgi:hypothetical protein
VPALRDRREDLALLARQEQRDAEPPHFTQSRIREEARKIVIDRAIQPGKGDRPSKVITLKNDEANTLDVARTCSMPFAGTLSRATRLEFSSRKTGSLRSISTATLDRSNAFSRSWGFEVEPSRDLQAFGGKRTRFDEGRRI